MSAQNVPTKSEYWHSFKDSAGALGEMLNEWLMNVVSATKISGAAATGDASWMKIREVNCAVLDSETCIGNGDANSMREMFSIGTQSTGVHNHAAPQGFERDRHQHKEAVLEACRRL